MNYSLQVAASLVLCTFMSAPIMYVSARMVLITYASESEYSHIISDTQKDVTVVTCICVVSICICMPDNVMLSALLVIIRFRCGYLHCFCWLGGTAHMLTCL